MTTNSREYMKEWRAAHPKKMEIYRTKWIKAHPEKMKECRKAWRDKHPDLARYYREYQRKRLGCMSRKEYFDKMRKPLSEWTCSIKNPKERARSLLLRAVARKRLIKPDKCESCQEPFPKALLQGHHKDHSVWWKVEWLCNKCHLKAHNGCYREE